MDRKNHQSISAARILADVLPRPIEQAEAGKLAVPAAMLRIVFEDVCDLVMKTKRRCGREVSASDFVGDAEGDSCTPDATMNSGVTGRILRR